MRAETLGRLIPALSAMKNYPTEEREQMEDVEPVAELKNKLPARSNSKAGVYIIHIY